MGRLLAPKMRRQSRPDALVRKRLAELDAWIDWLRANGAAGYLGEFGWPNNADQAEWNGLSRHYYRRLNAARLWATPWSSGRGWGSGYNLGIYVNGGPDRDIDTARSPADVVEAYPTSPTYRRGVNLSGFEFGADSNRHHSYTLVHSAADFRYLRGRGVDLVRLGLAWERMQPVLGAALDDAALDALSAMVAAAESSGIGVILDLHNYCRYTVGARPPYTTHVMRTNGGRLHAAHLLDFWRRMSDLFKDNAAVVGYGLMNEPHALDEEPGPFGGSTRYAWNASTDDWSAEAGGATLAHSAEESVTGSGSLRLTRARLTPDAYNNVRVNDGGQRLGGTTPGDTLRVWAKLEAGDAPLPWRAILQWQDRGYDWHSPENETALVPGQWVEVIGFFPAGIVEPRAFGCQAMCDDVGGQTSVALSLDDYAQGGLGAPKPPATVWEEISQRVVADLRTSKRDEKLLLVPGYAYTKVQGWSQRHPRGWIFDPAAQFRYEAHHYWDNAENGEYRNSYAEGVAQAESEGR